MIWLVVIWLIFTIVFGFMGWRHWKMSGENISHFQFTSRPMDSMPGVEIRIGIKGSDIDQPLKDFVAEFNKYLDSYNQKSSKSNKAQAVGYWVACATAIFSAVLTAVF